jgi:hypothetical protein
MPAMPLSARALNRATLARQMLLRRERVPVVEAVRRVLALQAQDPVGPYLALWSRVEDFDPGELDQAFTAHEVVRAHLMRITIHAVAAADYPPFHAAMQRTLRAARLHDERFRRAGLSIPDTDALIPGLAAYLEQPRTTDEVEAWLDERIGVRERPGVWWALRHYGPFVHAPVGGPWSFGVKRVMTAARLGPDAVRDAAAGLLILVRRYLEAFGPASLTDMRQSMLVDAPALKAAVQTLGDDLIRLDGPGKAVLYDLADAPPLPDDDTPAPPRFLPMWDNVLLAYADRSRLIPPELRTVIARKNGDLLPTVLVDGVVAGVWRPVPDGPGIEVTALTTLDDDAWAALETEAKTLDAFLAARDRSIYRRHQNWWRDLPAKGIRILGGG